MDGLDDDGIAGVAFAAAAVPQKVNESVDIATFLGIEQAGFVDQSIEALTVACVIGG